MPARAQADARACMSCTRMRANAARVLVAQAAASPGSVSCERGNGRSSRNARPAKAMCFCFFVFVSCRCYSCRCFVACFVPLHTLNVPLSLSLGSPPSLAFCFCPFSILFSNSCLRFPMHLRFLLLGFFPRVFPAARRDIVNEVLCVCINSGP